MQKKQSPPVTLKNIWLEHKNDLSCVPDLIDLEIPWDTVNLILNASDIKHGQIQSVNISASSQLLKFSHDENDTYARLDGASMTVGREWFNVTLWVSRTGDEITTMDIPIDALLQTGMFCIRTEDGKVVEPSIGDRDCFYEDEWEYVIAPTLEIAATKCTHNVQPIRNIKELGEEPSAFSMNQSNADMPQ